MLNRKIHLIASCALVLCSCGGSGTQDNIKGLAKLVEPLGNNNFQYLGIFKTNPVDENFYHGASFYEVSEKFTTEILVELIEEPFDSCELIDHSIPSSFSYDPYPTSSTSFLATDKLNVAKDSNSILATAYKTPVLGGDITLMHEGIILKTSSPQSDYRYDGNLKTAGASLLDEVVSFSIAGKTFPPYSNILIPMQDRLSVLERQVPTHQQRTTGLTWTQNNNELTYLTAYHWNGDFTIKCIVSDDGQFEIPDSIITELENTSSAAYQDYMNGSFKYDAERTTLKLDSNGDSLLLVMRTSR